MPMSPIISEIFNKIYVFTVFPTVRTVHLRLVYIIVGRNRNFKISKALLKS